MIKKIVQCIIIYKFKISTFYTILFILFYLDGSNLKNCFQSDKTKTKIQTKTKHYYKSTARVT